MLLICLSMDMKLSDQSAEKNGRRIALIGFCAKCNARRTGEERASD